MHLRGLGYEVEQFTHGRDLLRRIGRASDFDIILIDHHTANPELIDLIAQLRIGCESRRAPVFVIASADKPPYRRLSINSCCLPPHSSRRRRTI